MFEVHGTAALAKLADKIGRLGSDAAKRAILANVGEEAVELVREGFEKQSDPYGSRWKPTLRGGRILQDSGRLRNSFHRRMVSSNEVRIGSSVSYGRYHQGGTRRMVRRAMVPFRGMPKKWEKRLAEVARLAWKSSVGFR